MQALAWSLYWGSFQGTGFQATSSIYTAYPAQTSTWLSAEAYSMQYLMYLQICSCRMLSVYHT